MKMKLNLILALMLGIGTVQAQNIQALKLEGAYVNKATGKVYLQKFNNKIFTTVDSATVVNGKFTFSTKVLLPELYGLSINTSKTPMYIFLDQNPVAVNLDSTKNYSSSVVKGSVLQDEFNAFKGLRDVNISDYIKAHPASLVSAYVLYRNFSYRLSPDQIEENMALLSPTLNNSSFVQQLKEITGVMNKVAVGKKAPDFSAADPAGKMVKLSDHYQKYTLIDFWASWCAPCRKENPNVVAAFQKYKDRGFAVFGVSLDKNQASWQKAIKDDGLNWLQVSELNYWNSEIAKQYGVRAIPANFLINANGVIVGKNLRGEKLLEKLEELLGSGSVVNGK